MAASVPAITCVLQVMAGSAPGVTYILQVMAASVPAITAAGNNQSMAPWLRGNGHASQAHIYGLIRKPACYEEA